MLVLGQNGRRQKLCSVPRLFKITVSNLAQVGFNAGDSINFYALEDSRTANIVHVNETTNTGQTGRWLFRIENADIDVGGCFKPGSGERRNNATLIGLLL